VYFFFVFLATKKKKKNSTDRRVAPAQNDGRNEHTARDAYSYYPPVHPTQESYPYRLHNSHDRQ
jgi:hypothetical protein